MADTTWSLTLNDRVSSPAQRAARELGALQRQFQSAGLAAKAFNRDGSINPASFSRGLALQRRALMEAAQQQRANARAAQQQQAQAAQAARKAQAQATAAMRAQSRDLRVGADELAMGFGMAAGIAGSIASIVAGIVVSVGSLVARLGGAVLEMIRFREASVTTMGMVLGGRGQEGIRRTGGAALRQAVALGRISPQDSRDVVGLQQQVATGGFQGSAARRALAAAMDVQAINGTDPTASRRFLLGLGQMRSSARLNDQDLRQTAEAASLDRSSIARRAASLAGINRREGESDLSYQRRIDRARLHGRITGQHGVTAVEQELAARTGQGLGGAARTLGQNSLSGAITNLTGSFGELILSMDNIEQSAGMQRFRTMLVGIASILNGSSAAGRQFQSTLRALIDGGFGALGDLVDPAMFERGFSVMLSGLRSMVPYVRAFVAGFRQGFAGALPAVATMFRTLFGMVSGGGGQGTIAFVQRLGQGLGTIASVATVVAGALGAVVTVLTALTTGIVAFAAQMVAVVSSSVQAFAVLGGQIVDGLIQGLRDGWGRLTGELTALAASLPAPVRDALGIRSPSRVFAELGRQLPAGMAVGIEGGTDRVRSAVNDMVAVPSLAQGAGMRGRSGPFVGELHIHVGEGGEDLAETVRGGVLSALSDLFDEAAAMEGA